MQALELSGPGQSRVKIDRKHACRHDPDTDADFVRGCCKAQPPRVQETGMKWAPAAGRRSN
jgi:hypothetical protein